MENKNLEGTNWYNEIKKNQEDCFFNRYWVDTIIKDENISGDSKYKFLDYLIEESTQYGYEDSNNNPKTILEEDPNLIPAELRNKAAKKQIEMYEEGKYSTRPNDLEKIIKDENISEKIRDEAKKLYDKSPSIELTRKKESEELTQQVINDAIYKMNND